MVVLDNGTNRLLDADEAGDYRPVLTFAASGAWTHGYRRVAPTMTMASASVVPLTPSASTSSTD
jgi:hypothetical protein